MEKTKTKTVYSTGLPYSEAKRPCVSDETADAILSLLVPFLKPVGDHAYKRLPTSDGRRRRKKDLKYRTIGDSDQPRQERPEICSYLDIGLNSTVRNLEALIGRFGSSSPASGQSEGSQKGRKDPESPAVVFVCRSSLPEPVCHSLPILIATASYRRQKAEPTRLVELSAKAEAALSAALGLPRVSALSVHHDAPTAGPLLRLIQEHIEPVEVPWLKEAPSTAYLPVKVNALEANIGSKKSSRKRKRPSG